jgi:hypothetical protein
MIETKKVSKKAVDYSPGMGVTRCKNCVFFRGGLCERVRGVIDPEYWCRLFKAAKSVRAGSKH